MQTQQYPPAVYDRHQPPYDDEISLVDLAKILIRRRWWVVGTGIAVLAAVLAFGTFLQVAPTFTLSTVYETAERSDSEGEPVSLQSREGLVRRVEAVLWPELSRQFLADNPQYSGMPYSISIDAPKDTNLIVLQTQARESGFSDVEFLHTQLMDRIVAMEESLLEQRRGSLQTRLDNIDMSLAAIEERSTSGGSSDQFISDRILVLGEQQVDLEFQLDSLRDGSVSHIAAQGGASGTGPSMNLILALGIVLAGFVGLMSAFIVEFVGRVKESLQQDNNRAQV